MVNINKIFKKIHSKCSSACSIFDRKQEQKNELQVTLAQILINSSDPEELKNKIVKEIAIALKAYRCFFIEYDSSTNNFKKVANSYNTQRDALILLGFDAESTIPKIAMKQKYMKSIVITDTEKFIKENKLQGTSEENYFKEYNVKASLTVRLEFGESFLGVLVVQYDQKKPFLQEVDLKFVENIAEHISIALYLSKLYVKEKTEKERERLLRSIISIMSEDYNLTQITQKVFEILGNIYNAQTVFINVNPELFKNFNFQNFLYQSNNKEPYNKEVSIDTGIYELPEFDVIKNKTNYIPDTHNFIIQNNLENSVIENYFNINNIKSLILLPILHENLSFGLLIIHFNKTNPMTKDDLDFIRIVTDQLAIAIKQDLNYQKQIKRAEREALLRKIAESIRTTLDITELKNIIVTEIGKTLDVDRCFIVEYDKDTDKFLVVEDEYLSSSNIGSYFGTDINTTVPGFVSALKRGQEIIIEDSEKFILQSDIVGNTEKNSIKKYKVKSAFAIPIYYSDQLLGTLVIHYVNKKYGFGSEELDLIRTLANQIGLGIYQAKLYEMVKKQNEREKLLREIITKVRQLEDHDKIYDYVLESLINLFNLDRTLHIHYSLEGNIKIRNEKVKNNCELMINQKIPNGINVDEIIQKEIIVMDNIENRIKNPVLRDYLIANSVKAFVVYSTESNIYPDEPEKLMCSTMIISNTPRVFTPVQVETFKLVIDTTNAIYMEMKQRIESERIKQTFLATLTHDLRSPINAEQKALEVIISNKLGSSLKDFSIYLEDIYRTNEELLRIVNNILTVYHYESGRFELNIEQCDISNIVDGSVNSMRPLAKDQQSEILINIEPNLPLVRADGNEINRVITNLLSNAIKHNKKGTSINISARKIDNNVEISVKDSGKGIPEVEKPNIFQRYPTAKRKVGTGLGLYLSKQIIDAHHGKIWFETELYKGTTFYFTLPIA